MPCVVRVIRGGGGEVLLKNKSNIGEQARTKCDARDPGIAGKSLGNNSGSTAEHKASLMFCNLLSFAYVVVFDPLIPGAAVCVAGSTLSVTIK